MSNARADLSVTVDVTCPECGHYFDLVSETNLNDEGWVLNQVLPNESWSEAHENFECSVICPECSVEFDVQGINW